MKVVIETELFENEQFKYVLDPLKITELDAHDQLPFFVEIGRAAGEFFRNIYIEPSSNVDLGEN